MSDECAMWVTGVGIQVLGRLSLFFTADRWLPHFTHIVFRTWAGRRGRTKGAQERAAFCSLCSCPRVVSSCSGNFMQ